MANATRKCKQCGEVFEKKRPLQYLCGTRCAIEYASAKNKLKVATQRKAARKKMMVYTHTKKYRQQLQTEINKLSRNIDAYFHFSCIDCGKTLAADKQSHASHFKDVGGNNSIRYNLHNVHASTSQCNLYHGGRKKEYKEGLIKRYSEEYAEYVDNLKAQYPDTKLSEEEVVEKLAIVRKLNRDFDTLEFNDGVSARNQLNTIIGIYPKGFY